MKIIFLKENDFKINITFWKKKSCPKYKLCQRKKIIFLKKGFPYDIGNGDRS